MVDSVREMRRSPRGCLRASSVRSLCRERTGQLREAGSGGHPPAQRRTRTTRRRREGRPAEPAARSGCRVSRQVAPAGRGGGARRGRLSCPRPGRGARWRPSDPGREGGRGVGAERSGQPLSAPPGSPGAASLTWAASRGRSALAPSFRRRPTLPEKPSGRPRARGSHRRRRAALSRRPFR